MPESTPPLTAEIAPARDIYSVTRLNREVRAVLEGSFPPLWVQGEISNLARPASGHWYFSLKDAHAQVRCAMFRNRNRALRFTPENGALVIVRAAASLYEGRGEFQLIVDTMEPAGAGALQQAFEELKRKLLAEGLFDEERKRPLPAFPRVIGVVTSPTGAAIRDILNVLRRRWPQAGVIVYPAAVQGATAPAELVQAVTAAGARRECDVLIIARGGGSLEDLWAFNNEALARTLAACPIPTVSGVGHEIDFTIADFVADRRAPTPSAAAELVSPDQGELRQRVAGLEAKLARIMAILLRQYRALLAQLGRRLPDPVRRLQGLMQRSDDLLLRLVHSTRRAIAEQRVALAGLRAELARFDPAHAIAAQRQRAAWLSARLAQGMRRRLERAAARLAEGTRTLQALGPQATLDRGYAIVTDSAGAVVRDAGGLRPGERMNARFARGSATAEVRSVTPAGDTP
jgi:exodeoxyribonuclease VII large subunit